MTKLNCCVNNCMHNNSDCCCISSIEVGGKKAEEPQNTCCNSFSEKNGSFTNSTESPNPSLDIKCVATNCIYNEDCSCCAEHVDIAGPSSSCSCQETLCSSFYCK